MNTTTRAWIGVLFAVAISLAATWHVPEDVLTIQAALDSLETGDSILVDAGLYIEALQAPNNLSFVMIGLIDTSKEHDDWAIVDPSWLDSSDRKACLRLPSQTSAVIRNIWFRNSWPMYPRWNHAVGGIDNSAAGLTFHNCRFDSTYRSISSNTSGMLTVEDCEFRNSIGSAAIMKDNTSGVTVRSCDFAASPFMCMFLGGNALVENCALSSTTTEWFNLDGPNNTVRGCTFTGSASLTHAVIFTGGASDLVVENNTFQNIQLTTDGHTVWLGTATDGTIEICGNQFVQIVGGSDARDGIGIDQGSNAQYLICDNLFADCVGGRARGIYIYQDDAMIVNNTFIGSSNSSPYVWARRTLNDTIRINNQSFAGTGWALAVDGPNFVNAENNWWGDSTGPYHATLNPNGLGATITGAADFDPWMVVWSDSDSTDISPDKPVWLPSATTLSAFPNPFNATATLKLIVNEPGIFRIDLFNLLGQHVQEIWSGAVAYEKQIAFDGRALSSGLYFVRVFQPIENRVAVLQKLVIVR
jgi:hypothetical protein